MEVLYHMRPYFAGIYSHKIVGISSRFLSVADRALEIISAPKGNDHALGLYGDAHLSEKRWLYNVIYIYSPSLSLYSLSLYIYIFFLSIYTIYTLYIYIILVSSLSCKIFMDQWYQWYLRLIGYTYLVVNLRHQVHLACQYIIPLAKH